VNTKRLVRHLEEWDEAKRRCGLSDAHVQMARELGIGPRRLGSDSDSSAVPLSQRIEESYVERFHKAVPDPAVALRQLLREARRQERAEAAERRQRKRRAERDHLEAMRVSMLTLRRLYGGPGADDDLSRQPARGMR